MVLNLNDNSRASDYSLEASFGARFVNLVIDTLCMSVLQILAISIIGMILQILLHWVSQSSSSNNSEPNSVLILFVSLSSLIIMISPIIIYSLYYIVFEYYFQRTLGKYVSKTIVTKEDGGRPTLGQIIGRTACRFIPLEAIIALFTSSFLHDTISGTKVVVKE